MERYADTWDRKIRDFGDMSWLWIANVEAFVHAQSSPELLAVLAEGQRRSRRMVAAQLRGVSEDAVTEEDVRALGSVHIALLTGVMVQCLTDPEHTPDGQSIARGLRAMAELLDG